MFLGVYLEVVHLLAQLLQVLSSLGDSRSVLIVHLVAQNVLHLL